jgi:hypothetical protein
VTEKRLDPADEISGFDRLTSMVIDSSTMIYARKAGFLGALASELELQTVPEVLEETGIRRTPGIEVVVGAFAGDHKHSKRLGETDAAVFALALAGGKPIATEDRGIMLLCEEHGLDFYNALMLAHLLLYRGALTEAQHEAALERLLLVSRYSKTVYAYAMDVLQAVRKFR